MSYRALTSFSGLISMSTGEIRDIEDASIAKDLLKIGYIEEYNPTQITEKNTENKKKRGKNR